ncbi:MAG: thioredoxin family protein [Chitinophagaceae bacterium]|nr:thioredoxin family protein [Chitinophagaceae bacterium]
MKVASVLFASLLFLTVNSDWGTDLTKAKQQASTENKYILLNFSGSDWCGPCIRMHKEIFESEGFRTLAADKLVLVNADFPRLKKNQLSKELQKSNEVLADQYNPGGIFPLTVLLNAEGKMIKNWEGFPEGTPENFLSQLKSAMNAAN